jgi:lipoprotein NlpD
MGRWGWPPVLALAVVQGCSFSQPAAPVQDRTGKPARPAPEVRAPAAGSATHVVQAGDTLYKIAFEHGLDHRRLAEWNALADAGRIRAGETLRLVPPPPSPAAPPATAPAPSGTAAIEARPLAPLPAAAPPGVPASALPAAEATPVAWAWPARGELLAAFDEAAGMKGLEIAAVRGVAIRAAAAGQVVYAGAGLRGYGKLIIIRHGKMLLSAYGHNDRLLVQEGQSVRLGQVIAEMGDTDAERVKLHFEIREYGKPVDPTRYLPTPPG